MFVFVTQRVDYAFGFQVVTGFDCVTVIFACTIFEADEKLVIAERTEGY